MDHEIVLDFGPRPRRYRVHAPPHHAEDVPPPVVLMLHGAGATAAWTLRETRWREAADRHGFLVVLPEGTCPDPDRPPDFLTNPQLWNNGGARARSGADDVGFIAAVLDDVARRYPADPRRVYATGFSNGAGMVFRLGAELAPRFAALAPVAGYCEQKDPRPARPLPTLYLVGGADPFVPLEGGPAVSPWAGGTVRRPPVADTLRRWAVALGCPTEPSQPRQSDGVRELVYGPGAGVAELRALIIDGLGHHWPGGRGGLNHRLAGPTSDRADANEVICSFCRRYFRP